MVPSIELIVAAFLLMAFLAAVLSNKLKIPYTLILVLAGVLVTVIASSLVMQGGSFQNLISQLRSIYTQLLQGGGGGLFVGLVVPPLIFEAMIHLRASDLKAVIKPSLVLATVGVLIATCVGGFILWKGLGLSPYVSFLFAALIAPTDAVTVLEVFRRVKVPSKLSTMLDTEAAFNDATGIVIFTIILSTIGLQKVTITQTLFSFGFTLGAGVLIGLGVAFIGELLSSIIEDKVAETILAVAVVYGSYALATGIGASGLIAVAVAGLYFGNFTMRSAMEPASREAITTFWQIAAFLGNSIAFLIIGFETNLITLSQSVLIILAAYFAVTIARAATVYPILALFNKFGNKISSIWRNIAMLGGVRGALSIALVATITTSAVISQGDIDILNTMVLGVALISIVFQVPLLLHYASKKLPQTETLSIAEIDEQFELIASHLQEVKKLQSEGRISNEEFTARIEENKKKLDELSSTSRVTVETRKIIRARATALYASFPKIPKRKIKNKGTKTKTVEE
ncbi:MAG TPA: sodium:proton antiporter [Candidatus Acidoferrum sp.]|nr:sodium:proton antiporter [Candidatus Acidoferrum sp.]